MKFSKHKIISIFYSTKSNYATRLSEATTTQKDKEVFNLDQGQVR